MPSNTEVEMLNGCLEALQLKKLGQVCQNGMIAQHKLILMLPVMHY